MADFIGKYSGEQIDQKLDKIKGMVGATASEAGQEGLVPASMAGEQNSFLRGDGKWADVNIPEPGFLCDDFENENDFRYILFDLAFNGGFVLTKDKYDIIASKCKVGGTVQYILSGPASIYGIGDVILGMDIEGNIQGVMRTGGLSIGVPGSISVQYTVDIKIGKDLVFTSILHAQTVAEGGKGRDIMLTFSDGGAVTSIGFSTSGAGNKALMDDGTYKEIGSSGVDISSYIFEETDFKKSTTKEGFDKIKDCVINKQHMYVRHVVDTGGEPVVFHSDVISSILYGNLGLIMFGPSHGALDELIIDSANYSITTTKL